MAISCESHLRAWLLEEVETLLVNQSENTLHWAADLFGGLLCGLRLKELLLEASCILPSATLQLFIAFALRQHPREVTPLWWKQCSSMPQLKLSFLATQQVNKQGLSVPTMTATMNSASETRSTRSQVRGSTTDTTCLSQHQSTGARASDGTPGPDAATLVAKNGDARLLIIRSTKDRIKKRSLRRAMRKAERDGAGTYKGHKLASWTPRFELQTSGARPSAIAVTQRRMRVVQWNVGGFSAELQMEWFAWLRQSINRSFYLDRNALVIHKRVSGRKLDSGSQWH